MLDSKVDKQIKRYLKKIALEIKPSTTNESIHYKIMYEDKKVDVRFAEHTSYQSKAFIDVIKVTEEWYRINVARQVQYTVHHDDMMAYLKALLLVGPELFKMVLEYQTRCGKALIELDKVKQRCENKLKHYDPEFMDQLWEERDKAVKLCESWVKKNLALEKELTKEKERHNKALKAIKNIRAITNNWK